jgi:hypothetical protein
MAGIVTRLKRCKNDLAVSLEKGLVTPALEDAIAEIESLTAQRDALRAALESVLASCEPAAEGGD